MSAGGIGGSPPARPEPLGAGWPLSLALRIVFWIVILAILAALFLFVVMAPEDDGTDWCCDSVCMFFLTEDLGDGNWRVYLSATSVDYDLDTLEARVFKYGTVVESMDPIDASASGDFTFTDLDGGGTLSNGDHFTIKCDEVGSYRLIIIWKPSDCKKGSVYWET